MKNTGKTFEKAVEQIFKYMYANYSGITIDRDVWLSGPEGKRQIDVLITMQIPDDKIITVIEGKDYKTKVDIPTLDAFHSKMGDVKANKGIIVSKKGFSSKAILKAQRLGITLYSLNDFSEFKEFDLKVPILIEEISPEYLNLRLSFERDKVIHLTENIYFDTNPNINNQDLTEIINTAWGNGALKFKLTDEEQNLEVPIIKPPYYLKYYKDKSSNDNDVVEISKVRINLRLKNKFYLCDIRDIMHENIIKNIEKEKLTFFIDTNSLSEKLKDLTPISTDIAKEFTGVQYNIRIRNKASVEFYRTDFIPPN
jgi:hypothetical protein